MDAFLNIHGTDLAKDDKEVNSPYVCFNTCCGSLDSNRSELKQKEESNQVPEVELKEKQYMNLNHMNLSYPSHKRSLYLLSSQAIMSQKNT